MDGDGHRERLTAWRELLRGAREHREGRETVWSLSPDRAGALADLVAAERSCCAFLDLRVEDGGPHVLLRVGLRAGRRPAPGGGAEEAARLLGALA
ncbi:hypothetical protein A6A08_23700 [Nocardiopsis sp. TSRI0078]|nr:hypothetical protein A6A08_23700 [Nocardiopsis sp. TSRI0078]